MKRRAFLLTAGTALLGLAAPAPAAPFRVLDYLWSHTRSGIFLTAIVECEPSQFADVQQHIGREIFGQQVPLNIFRTGYQWRFETAGTAPND